MKSYPGTDARTVRKLSIATNRRPYKDRFDEAAPRSPERAAARGVLEIYDAFQPVLHVFADCPIATEPWRAALRMFNQALESVGARSASHGPRLRKRRLAATTETPGTTPDFRAGRDL